MVFIRGKPILIGNNHPLLIKDINKNEWYQCNKSISENVKDKNEMIKLCNKENALRNQRGKTIASKNADFIKNEKNFLDINTYIEYWLCFRKHLNNSFEEYNNNFKLYLRYITEQNFSDIYNLYGVGPINDNIAWLHRYSIYEYDISTANNFKKDKQIALDKIITALTSKMELFGIFRDEIDTDLTGEKIDKIQKWIQRYNWVKTNHFSPEYLDYLMIIVKLINEIKHNIEYNNNYAEIWKIIDSNLKNTGIIRLFNYNIFTDFKPTIPE
jgi:hypothetical protein